MTLINCIEILFLICALGVAICEIKETLFEIREARKTWKR